jgi:hypothetical protein
MSNRAEMTTGQGEHRLRHRQSVRESGNRAAFVAAFAIAMAWMEAAVVFDLRVLIDRIVPYQVNPLPMVPVLGEVELVREAATLVMLWAVGRLAGATTRARWAYSALAFGIWDIAYYLFLHYMTGWPGSLWDWDVLFLLPLPWWGPVAAPLSLSVLLVLGGGLVAFGEFEGGGVWPGAASLRLAICGAVGALALFLWPALQSVPSGQAAVRAALPSRFPWELFGLAWLAMAAPVVELAVQAARKWRAAECRQTEGV